MWFLALFFVFIQILKYLQHFSMGPYTVDCSWSAQTNSKIYLILEIYHLQIFWIVLQDNFTEIQTYLSDSIFLFGLQYSLQLLQPNHRILIVFLYMARLTFLLLLNLLLFIKIVRMNSESRHNIVLVLVQHSEQWVELVCGGGIHNNILDILLLRIHNDLMSVQQRGVVKQMRMRIHEGTLLESGPRLLWLHRLVNRLNQIIITFILMMQSGNLNSVEISERHANDTMKRANTFLSELHQIPSKYTQQERDEFITEFNELNDHQRYTCAEVILSNAWGHINSNRLSKARADLGLIIPLCVQKDQKQLDFPEFQVDRMVYESWGNDRDFPEEKRDAYNKLMEQCGFQFQKYKQPIVRKKQKSGFRSFLDILTCKCCAKPGG